jgi:hypothetical protein
VSLDVWLVPCGSLPRIEHEHLMERIISFEYDDPAFLFLKKYWSELELEYGEIDPWDSNWFSQERLVAFRETLYPALRGAEALPETWHQASTDGTAPTTPYVPPPTRVYLLETICCLLEAANRGLRDNKELLFFGD